TQWRADAAEWTATLTTEVVLSVGDGLRALYGRQDFGVRRIAPLVLAIERARASWPLDEESLLRAAGLR
ncbi:MAG: hypothetical protein M3389_03995, partial [Actinomycetota bacterium]|nr:hypothetical protein [Actinomycetota bacterium]